MYRPVTFSCVSEHFHYFYILIFPVYCLFRHQFIYGIVSLCCVCRDLQQQFYFNKPTIGYRAYLLPIYALFRDTRAFPHALNLPFGCLWFVISSQLNPLPSPQEERLPTHCILPTQATWRIAPTDFGHETLQTPNPHLTLLNVTHPNIGWTGTGLKHSGLCVPHSL